MVGQKLSLPFISRVRILQRSLLGKLSTLGFDLKVEAQLDAVTLEIIKNSEIEGETLNGEQMRSLVAGYLGLDSASMPTTTREIDAVVEMMLSATYHYQQPLLDDLLGWHRGLFPDGYSGLYRISIHDDSKGQMKVVSGGYGRERVHFVAPSTDRLPDELSKFLLWFNLSSNEQDDMDLVVKAGIAHLWFVTLHSFDDGNGRLTRALTERMLAKSDNSTQLFYSISAQILKQRNDYYQILERTQKGDKDITDWLVWFLQTLEQSLAAAQETTDKIISKSAFGQTHRQHALNDMQVEMLNILLTDFYGKLTTKKWATMTKCSIDTALRDINDLIEKGMMQKSVASGRSTSYELVL
ncbi:LOW QUALITY PROTEIN: Fic family protein [Psychrobacter sp. JCM 18901]|nr:LOW QUALITY PROTEIN: Fic family protein [Psychrobacter sp. JCM 18901]